MPLLRNLQPSRRSLIAAIVILALLSIVLIVSLLYVTTVDQQSADPLAPMPSAAPEPTVAPIAPSADKSTLILELFNPSDQHLTQQFNETTATQQIEQVMTVSYVLKKCSFITDEEYKDSFRALIVYAQKLKLAPDAASAEARVRIAAESAGAGYALLYSRTKCDSAQLPELATQLLTWRNAMLDQ